MAREFEIYYRISCWDDLRLHGIEALTGEACGWALRLLCDVTKPGKELIERFFGGNITVAEGSNWNGSSRTEPHVGSVMLPHSILPELAAFTLAFRFSRGVAITKDGEAVAYEGEWPQDTYPLRRIVRRPENNTAESCDRNTHQMSGRTI